MAESKLRDLSVDFAEIIDCQTAEELYRQCGTIRRILIASINTAKEHTQEHR